MDVLDISFKLFDVALLIDQAIKTHKKVYIHCSAGLFRSPLSIMAYFHLIKGITINKVIKLMYDRHP